MAKTGERSSHLSCLLTTEAKDSLLFLLVGFCRQRWGKHRRRDHEIGSLLVTTASSKAAIFLAASSLDARGILFKSFFVGLTKGSDAEWTLVVDSGTTGGCGERTEECPVESDSSVRSLGASPSPSPLAVLEQFPFLDGRQETQRFPSRTQTQRLQTACAPLHEQQQLGAIFSLS